jgi:capsule biosynthesis phosphatase
MRIVIDLDGTICNLKEENETYADVKPKPGVVEILNTWKEEGHVIIIQTARNMATQQSNLGKVLKNVGLVTLEWLERHQIPYDEIYFGKPNGHIYIDDRAFRFTQWEDFRATNILDLGQEK